MVSLNPATAYVLIAISAGVTPTAYRLTVMSASGWQIMHLCPTRSSISLSTSQWAKDFYFVTLNTPKGATSKNIIILKISVLTHAVN